MSNQQLPAADRIEAVKVQPDGQFLIQWSAQLGPNHRLTYGVLFPEIEAHQLMRKLSAAWLASGRPAPR